MVPGYVNNVSPSNVRAGSNLQLEGPLGSA